MANVKTYNLTLWKNDGTRTTFHNISRVAVERYLNHYQDNPDYINVIVKRKENETKTKPDC